MNDGFRNPPYPAPDLGRAHLATVVSVEDPDRLARVQVRLLGCDGVQGHDAPLWARVAVPFAGADRGAFFIPTVGDEVLVVFVDGDRRFPIVVGSLWNGRDAPPETLPGNDVDRWTITGKAGTRIAIIEESAGQEKILVQTPGGVKAELTDAAGGSLRLQDTAGNSITLDSSGISVQSSGTVQVQASQVKVSAGMVQVDAGMSKFSGVVKCDTLIATSVVGSTYTPGAGNVW